MVIQQMLKQVGRGAAGARPLTRSQARDVMAALLDGQVPDLELGAFVMAMRMKGETLDELCGFLDAVEARLPRWSSAAPIVLLPSYNGARKLPNLTPLVAMELAQAGARVLVHGPLVDPGRVTSAQVLADLGLPALHTLTEVEDAWARRQPAFVDIAALCPPLARLLSLRQRIGLRNSAHTVAKMLSPFRGQRALRLVNHTHPEFGALMAQWAAREGVDAMLLRGTEGEPVADPRRLPRIDCWVGGARDEAASCAAQEGSLATLPLLPQATDAATTALYVQSVLAGERPAPAPIARQVDLVLRALGALRRISPAQAVNA